MPYMSLLKPLQKVLIHVRRTLFLRSIRKRLKNQEFTLITNDCFGGIIYHQLGLPFQSPTINLYFDFEGYLAFARDIPYYLGCEIEDVSAQSGLPFPVGRIVPKDESHIPVTLNFVHYNSFEEAVSKWKKRAERIHYDNIVFLYYHLGEEEPDLFREFETLPGKKMMILQRDMPGCGLEHYCYLRTFEPEKGVNHWLDREGSTGRRVCNRFDFVSFLNGDNTIPRSLGCLPPYFFNS